MTPEDRGGVRIGVLVPFTNTHLEPDLMMMRPRGSTLHFHRLGNYGQGKLSPDEVAELACRADHPDAQALVLSCTDMRSVEVIERIESRLGKVVITSNQAMMFCLMRALGLKHQDNCPGQLFDLLKGLEIDPVRQ